MRQASLTIRAPRLASLAFNNTFSAVAVPGGATVTGTARLDGPTPPAGFTVQMNNNAPSVTGLPSPFPVIFNPDGQPVGQRNFSIVTRPVHSDVTVTMGAGSVNRSFTVQAPRVQSLALAPMILTPGATATATATLTGPAAAFSPTSPNPAVTAVTPSSANAAVATVGGLAIVPGGRANVSFAVTGANVKGASCTSISASLNGSTQSTYVGVAPTASTGVGLAPEVIYVPMFTGGAITLRNPSPARVTYGFTSSRSDFVLSANSAGAPALGSATVTITPQGEGCAMVTATAGGQSRFILVIATAMLQG